MQQQQHSMNSFPGFRVLKRTVVLPKPPTTTTQDGSTLPTTILIAATNVETTTDSSPFVTMMEDPVVGAAAGETNNDSCSGEICCVQYAYKPSASAPPPFSLQLSFMTHETTERRPSKSNIQKRIEGLLSHRIYNGVDNTGNVRVWDSYSMWLRPKWKKKTTILATMLVAAAMKKGMMPSDCRV